MDVVEGSSKTSLQRKLSRFHEHVKEDKGVLFCRKFSLTFLPDSVKKWTLLPVWRRKGVYNMCTWYIHYRTGKVMYAKDYGYKCWPFGRPKSKKRK